MVLEKKENLAVENDRNLDSSPQNEDDSRPASKSCNCRKCLLSHTTVSRALAPPKSFRLEGQKGVRDGLADVGDKMTLALIGPR